MKSICSVKFDFEVIDKVDEILQKHGIKFSYHDYMEKLQKKYGIDMKTFCDDYTDDIYIDWNKCSAWKKKYKKLCINEDTSIIEIEHGFINQVYYPEKIDNNETYEVVFDEGEYIDSLEELDKWLTEIETRLDGYLHLITSKDTKDLYKDFLACNEEKDNIEKQINEKKKKIRQSINLVLSAKKDFT